MRSVVDQGGTCKSPKLATRCRHPWSGSLFLEATCDRALHR
jgi:hypothetical protein